MSIYKICFPFKNSMFMLFGFILLFASMAVKSESYIPPIGIPAPEFGINESHTMYTNAEYDFGNGLEPYNNAANGPYTHYVDNTHLDATDDGNPNGSFETPRMTIPKTLAAGSVVELHGGPYSENSNIVPYQMNGTKAAPIFIRGVSNGTERVQVLGNSATRSRMQIELLGQYFIIENIEFYNRVNINFDPTAKYGTLRNSEVHNPFSFDETGVIIGNALNPTIAASGEHTVIYNNEIHSNAGEARKDVAGIQGSAGGDRIWILNNTIYDNGGDGIIACHRCDRSPLGQPKNIYIGGNDFSNDKENAIDLKYATDVIISQNRFSNYRIESTTGPVCPIVVGSDGFPTRVWIIFNEFSDSKRAIRVEEAPELWILGNTIYNIDQAAIALEKRGDALRIVNNTVYNAGLFIDQFRRDIFAVNVHNNIVVDMTGEFRGNHMNFKSRRVYLENSDFRNNLFWQSGDDVIMRLGESVQFSTTMDFDAYPFGNSNIIADPLFVNPEDGDFRLQENSPARDSGLENAVSRAAYQEFFDLYGINIQRDKDGLARPQQNIWDRGAFEYLGGLFSNGFEGN